MLRQKLRKLHRILFSQAVIVIVLMLLQVVLMLSVITVFSESVFFLDAALFILTTLAVISLINSDKDPTYKLSWVIPIMLLPLFGGLFYFYVQGQTATRKFFQRVKSIDKSFTGKIPQSEEVLAELRESFPSRYSTVSYTHLNEYVGYSVFANTDVKYYPLGEVFWKDLLEALEAAEKYIFLEYFIIGIGEMWGSVLEILKRKAAAGVDVRVMYDGVGSLLKIPSKYPIELTRYGIKCKTFMPFLPFLSTLQNNRDHRKIAVIDGKVAFNGGVNLDDEYVNLTSPHGHWKDTAVRLTGDAAYSFAVIFLQMWQATENKATVNPEDFRPEWSYKAKDGGYVMPYADTPNDDYQVGEFVYTEIISKAKNYVHITSPYLIIDNVMQTALINAARCGVDVKIIIPRVADHWYAYYVAMDYARELIEKGVEVYEYTPGFIHAKNFSSDGEVAVVGSINLDFRSLYLHFECATWMVGCPAVAEVERDFNETLKLCRRLTAKDINSRPLYKRVLSATLRIFAPLM